MSFQIYFRDEIHALEGITVPVADSEEEFRNTTVEELKRKLIPEDQLADTILLYGFEILKKNRTLGFYGIKHEDPIIAVRCRIPFSVEPESDSLPVHESVKNTKLDNSDLDDHTLGFGIKHEDEITAAETASSGRPPKDEDEVDKVFSRSQSKDIILCMHQPPLKPSE